jgi:hypothetical protein
MANEQHLAILGQGVKAWNQWRQKTPKVIPDLSGADFNRDLRGTILDGVVLSGNILIKAGLSRADLSRADLSGVDLRRANLSGADLIKTDFSRANLSRANLSLVNLSGANLSRADLFRANLSGADLSGVNFNEANIGLTIFGDVDLSQVKRLDTVKHFGPSTIGIDTIHKSGGNIPVAFLLGTGVPDNIIAYVRSLVGQPIQYYTCFISYSGKDQLFAERLYNDLQGKGVRCWFAPESLKTGDKFRSRIDEAIKIYDKLLVILSENSIESAWVEEEVETALERERQQSRIMLFPIRLDDAVMKTHQAWAASIRRVRHIGDFSNWKDHDRYQVAFARLLRDLQAEDTK